MKTTAKIASGAVERFQTCEANQRLGAWVRQLSAFDAETEIFRHCRTTAAV
jgi:hypothetical protein